MSLVSSTRLVGGLREYTYRGFQQLPLVIGSTSLLFTIATGSIAHANLALGMGVVMPVYTVILQKFIGFSMNYIWKDSLFWKRISSDSCRIIPDFSKTNKLSYYVSDKTNEYDGAVPSYWLMSIAFFIGYSISNAVDSLQTPAEPGSNEINHEKRNHHATIVIITTVLFAFFLLLARFFFMPGCEGVGSGDSESRLFLTLALVTILGMYMLVTIVFSAVNTNVSWTSWGAPFFVCLPLILSYYFGGGGIFLSLLAAVGAGVIGYGMYTLSRKCGARNSDLFGILSQILPISATRQKPVVCTAQEM
jgi:hypothetical protein